MKFFGKTFKIAISAIALLELLSFIGFLSPAVNKSAFVFMLAITLYLTLKRLEYGVFMVLGELFIASKGYLLYFDLGGSALSLRIGLWLVVMSVWMGQSVMRWIRNKKTELPITHSALFPYFAALFVFIIWGAVNGWLNGNRANDIFFDLNGWLYFALLFPVYEIFLHDKERMTDNVVQILSASAVWLSFKTFFLLYIFTHGLVDASGTLYRWVRTSGVGEITSMSGGFFRVFIQSQIFILIFFFISLFRSVKIILGRKRLMANLFLNSLFLGTIIASLSRSFWIGLVVGIFLFASFLVKEKFFLKNIFLNIASVFISSAIGIFIIVLVAKFPLPAPIGGFDFSNLFSNRATEASGEAGISSRMALLPKLAEKIKQAPVIGSGFGTAVTYKTSDPRALQSNMNGEYTTYAFEWGWLDVWVKLGLFGLIAYLFLLLKIFLVGVSRSKDSSGSILEISLAVGVLVIASVSFFSPYTNHPLGIGYIILAGSIISANRK